MSLAGYPIIPDHELLRLIGRGSYGEVWMARSALGTYRAVKIVRRASFDSDRPFARELSGIRLYEPVSRAHEGLVDILQVGHNEAGRFFYYVMELADDANTGKPVLAEPGALAGYRPRLLAVDEQHPVVLPTAAAIVNFLTLAEGLRYLHGAGLLHRDIKPANVVFVGGVPKLADLGLVAEAGESRTFVGTEGFIPPEGPGTVAADIYALGKLMYETATGKDRLEFPSLPLHRNSPQDNATLLELNAVLIRCCDPDPRRRYPSAADLSADLALLRSGHSVQRIHSNERRLRIARRMGVVASIALGLLCVANIWVRRQARIAQDNFTKSETLRTRFQAAERAANDHLFEALIAQARAERRNILAGSRKTALVALSQAAQMRGATPELRSEAISALALDDISLVRRIRPPIAGPNQISISPNGKIIAQSVAGGAVEVREVETRRLIHSIADGGKPIGPFSGDGQYLVTLDASGHQRILNLATGQCACRLEEVAPYFVDFGPGPGQFIVQRETRLSIRNMDGTTAATEVLPFIPKLCRLSPRNSLVGLGDQSRERVTVIQIPGGREVDTLRLSAGVAAIVLAWSPDGSALAVGTANHRVLVWKPGARDAVLEFLGHGAEVVGLSWSPDGELLSSGSWDGTTRLWSIPGGKEVIRQIAPDWNNLFLADGKGMAFFNPAEGEMELYELSHHEICRILREPGTDLEKSPNQVLFSEDGHWLFEGCQNGLRAFRASDGRLMGELHCDPVLRLVPYTSPSHKFVAITLNARGVVEWSTNLQGGVTWKPFKSSERDTLAANDPGGLPWVGHHDNGLALYYANGTIRHLPASETGLDVAISQDGRWAAASMNAHAAYWELGILPELPRFHDLGPARSYGIAISHDGNRIYHATAHELVCTDPRTAHRLWQSRLTETSFLNAGIVESPDGRLVAAELSPFSISLVDSQTGVWIATIEHPHPEPINHVAFSPDGHWLAAACTTHITQIWDLWRLHSALASMKADWH